MHKIPIYTIQTQSTSVKHFTKKKNGIAHRENEDRSI